MAKMRAWVLACVVAAIACGGKPSIPKRGVVEGDLDGWKFRRFQPVLDVEVWIEKNPAEAYTASYVSEQAEKTGRVGNDDVVSVFVTRYERDDGVLRQTVKLARRLAAEGGYQVDESKIRGTRALSIQGHGEAWVMWAAPRHVIKVGGRGRESVPEAMVASYARRYPSVIPGGVLEGPLPPGPDNTVEQEHKPAYDANNPRPDLDGYDPNKTKLPPKKK
jgi:hypothetical protein